jgi:hypothetical protein
MVEEEKGQNQVLSSISVNFILFLVNLVFNKFMNYRII